ncbi:ABC transporter permease [Peterkaempfera sp. SMS 1(5)a]|uniref:ABC transporter permease n=1 Tax=Peterkaempfera podocarpi TaxID=3232308 RepID=UPI00366B2EAE
MSTSDTSTVVPDAPGQGREAPSGASRPVRRDTGFLRYLASKTAAAVISFAITLVIGFVLFNLLPADPVQTMTRGRPTSDAQMAQLRHQLGLDQSLAQRFVSFVGDVLTGHLGTSWQFQQSVTSLIAERLWPTVLLMGSATVISAALGLWLGVRSGWRRGSLFDKISSSVSLTLWSVPTFWLGMILLIVFAVGLGPVSGFLPTGGMTDPSAADSGFAHILDVARHLVLPCLTMILVVFAQYVMIMRSSIIDELGSPYLLTVRAKGLTDDQVRRRHAVPNALLPSVTMIFLHLGSVVGGAITVETVFSWPGLGYLSYQALQVPDLPLLQGTFLVFSASVILMNLLADIAYRFLDPRVRAQ